MSRATMVAGNWKMNTTLAEALSLVDTLAGAALPAEVEVAVFPPFPWLVPIRDRLGEAGILLGAQNCYTRESGAFTGEVSTVMLAEVCNLVLAGHSERRHVFGESDALVGEKVDAILRAGMRAVLCVGETLSDRERDQANAVVERQLHAALRDRASNDLESLVVAYEPVWAIGTGVAATPEDAQMMCGFIRSWLDGRFEAPGRDVTVLYGGSVTPENAGDLFGQPDIDGGLVGGASLKAESFLAIVNAATK